MEPRPVNELRLFAKDAGATHLNATTIIFMLFKGVLPLNWERAETQEGIPYYKKYEWNIHLI